MHNLEKPKNQWALSIWLLLENKNEGVTMAKACELYFHKFQSRLLEIEAASPAIKETLKIRRVWMQATNRLGSISKFFNYKSLATESELIRIYNAINSSRAGKRNLKELFELNPTIIFE